jgi:hypothetical protein
MGYYTHYELTWETWEGEAPTTTTLGILEELTAITKASDVEGFGEHFIEHGGGVATDQRTKWYAAEVDLAALSRAHPGVLFKLDGHGDAGDDIWRKFWLNGVLLREWRPELTPPEVP